MTIPVPCRTVGRACAVLLHEGLVPLAPVRNRSAVSGVSTVLRPGAMEAGHGAR